MTDSSWYWKAVEKNSETWLYRQWDIRNNLLYVGITSNVLRRLGQHISTSPWRMRYITYQVNVIGHWKKL